MRKGLINCKMIYKTINIADKFVETANLYHDKIAVIYNDREMTFSEIKKMSNIIAWTVHSKVNKISPIAVFISSKADVVVSDLGIILAGKFFMNLDVSTPIDRIKKIIIQTNPALILVDKNNESCIKSITNEYLVFEDIINSQFNYEDFSIEKFRRNTIDSEPFCIINTSGTTGVPKSVVLSHRSFINFVNWAYSVYGFSYRERIASLSPVVFDIYVYELCMMIFHGATLILIPSTMAIFPYKMLMYLEKQEPTFLFWVPTIMVNIANRDMLSGFDFRLIKNVWFAGEVFPTKQYNYWHKMLPTAQFTNLYGPIEITVDCTYYIIDHEIDDNEEIPLGYSCNDANVFILNDRDTIADINEEGEICVRSSSLAMGYYNDEKNTLEHFVQNPLQHNYPEIIYRTGDIGLVDDRGLIMFKGRKDTLIKHMGYRIELNEIEHIIISVLRLVDNGCSIYDANRKVIIFIYEAESEIAPATFKKQLSKKLPKYMIPTVYIRMSTLPRNTNGKIDRARLKDYKDIVDKSVIHFAHP